MFKTLATLINGANARSEDRVRDAFAIELIDQKIREAEGSLRAAKSTLASLIQRQRAEDTQRKALQSRINDLTKRAQAALDNDRSDMAQQAAEAIAQMENELTVRTETLARLDQKASSTQEAEELINRVLGQDDPFEQAEILGQINRDLDHGGITDQMADAGFGGATRATADDVLNRLKSKK